MARAEALVFPSLWPEPLSRVLLEALALGTPVAAMDTGGTREILGEERERPRGGGRRRARRTPSAACAATPPCARASREAARARAKAFSPEVLVPRYEAVYRRLAVRVALLSRSAHPLHAPGGLERAVFDLARHLQAKGVETILFTRPPAHAARDAFPGEVVTVPYGSLPGRPHGRVLDRVALLSRASRAGRARPRPGWCARVAPTSCTRRASPPSATAASGSATAACGRRSS